MTRLAIRHSAIATLCIWFVSPVAAADPKSTPTLNECLELLRSENREDRLKGVEGIRDHHPKAVAENLPKLFKVFGQQLDRPFGPHIGRSHMIDATVRAVVESVGADRVKAFAEGVRDKDALVRCGAYHAWTRAAMSDPKVDRTELLQAAEKGISDKDEAARWAATEVLKLYNAADQKTRARAVELLTVVQKERTAPTIDRERSTPAAMAARVLEGYRADALLALPEVRKAIHEGEIGLSGSAAHAVASIALGVGGKVAREVTDELFRVATNPDATDLQRGGALSALRQFDLKGGPESCLTVVARAPAEVERKQAQALGKMLAEPDLSPQLGTFVMHVLQSMGEGGAPAAHMIPRVKASKNYKEQIAACVAWGEMKKKVGPEVTEFLPKWRDEVSETIAELKQVSPLMRDDSRIGSLKKLLENIKACIEQTK